MKANRILTLAALSAVALAAVFTACSKTGGGDDPKPTYTVTFDADGGTPAPAAQKVTEGETVAAPAAMTKTGYTFDGWYTDAALTGKAAFPYAVTADVTLHAKWTAEAVEEEPQIELPNDAEKEQQAFADDETTGGFTFTAKSAWTATVTETGGSTRASNVAWLRLLFDGEETYSGAAGSFTLVIELDENYSGETRTATITIKSGGDTITITVTQDGKTEEGVVPVEPGKPVPDGMRYVSRIDADYSYIFEYDSKNRVSRITSDDYDDSVIATFSYDDAARTVTMTQDRGSYDSPINTNIFELNTSGAIVSGEISYSDDTITDTTISTYTNGYINKFTLTDNEEEDYTEIFTMTWSGGNMSRTVHEDPDFDPVTENLKYNTSWADNPLCNLDLNALIYQFDDGIYDGLPELLGLFGNRSRHMLSGYTTIGGNLEGTNTSTVEYGTDGFVSKITKVNYQGNTVVYTITYR